MSTPCFRSQISALIFLLRSHQKRSKSKSTIGKTLINLGTLGALLEKKRWWKISKQPGCNIYICQNFRWAQWTDSKFNDAKWHSRQKLHWYIWVLQWNRTKIVNMYIIRGRREQGIKGWMSNKQSIELLRKIAFY